jgi:anti-sigma regulatory factor (Ser/Thr protein kinase)
VIEINRHERLEPWPTGQLGPKNEGGRGGVCTVVDWVLPCAPSSVPKARHLVRSTVEGWRVPEDDPAISIWEDLELVIGELTGNASRFCRGRIGMRLEVHRDRVRLEVVDDGSGTESLHLKAPSAAPDTDAESGRGLVIVSALAQSWGADRTTTSVAGGNGTKVWAELPFPQVSPHFTRNCQVALSPPAVTP